MTIHYLWYISRNRAHSPRSLWLGTILLRINCNTLQFLVLFMHIHASSFDSWGRYQGQLLDFYVDLDHFMPHFDPERSTTHDVVRQAIIPNSLQYRTEKKPWPYPQKACLTKCIQMPRSFSWFDEGGPIWKNFVWLQHLWRVSWTADVLEPF